MAFRSGLVLALAMTVLASPAAGSIYTGDVNADGVVGADDLGIVLTNWANSQARLEQGDLTGDGFVGSDDLNEVLTYWGTRGCGGLRAYYRFENNLRDSVGQRHGTDKGAAFAPGIIGQALSMDYYDAVDVERYDFTLPENSVKFGIVTDVHQADFDDVSSDKYFTHSQAKMTDFIADMNNDFQPDFIIELGDFVEAWDVNDFNTINAVYNTSTADRYHVMGNHEGYDARSEWLAATGYSSTYYSFDRQGYHFVVLDANYSPDGGKPLGSENVYIPQFELDWLQQDLAATDLTTVVFSHHGFGEVTAGIQNYTQVRAVLEDSGKVTAAFHGHSHHSHYANINGIDYYSIEAMTDDPYPDTSYARTYINTDTDRITIDGRGSQYDYPENPANAEFDFVGGQDEFTVSLWMKQSEHIPAFGGTMGLIGNLFDWNSAYGFSFYLWSSEGNDMAVARLSNGAGHDAFVYNYRDFNLDEWHFWTLVFDTEQIKWYLDGLFRDSAEFEFEIGGIGGMEGFMNLMIGTDEVVSRSPTFFKGEIDEVKIWNRALTAQEVTTEYHRVYPPEALIINGPGDVDGDGFVGAGDLTVILTNWARYDATRIQGDLNGDGFVGADDYVEVVVNWGPSTAPEPVPEPAGLTLLLFATAALLARRKK